MTIFQSYMMGGFECSTHRRKDGRRLDLIASTRHDVFAVRDYERMMAMGMKTARDGIRWHLIDAAPGKLDFSSALGMVRAARATGIQIIWDLLHYGWPDGLDIFSHEAVERFAAFSREFAKLLAAESDEPPIVCPVNEISFFAWAGGAEAIFNPNQRGRGDDLKMQLVRLAIAAVQAVRDVVPEARIVHTDPAINVVPDPSRPQDKDAAEHHRLSQYEAFDMISGRLHPELGGRPEYLDILGLNYYVHNQWTFPGGFGSMIEPSNALYRPVWQLIRDNWERYRRPIFIAETGIEDDARPAWLRYVGWEMRNGIRAGIPIEGICLYPILNHPGWDDDRHCYNGLWDYPDETGQREVYRPLAEEVHKQARLFRELLETEHPDQLAEGRVDPHELDVAAHWMEITSTHGFQKDRPARPE